MKIAICDDERECQLRIEKLVKNLNTSETIEISTFSSGEDIIESYKDNKTYSIVLLDMQMKELGGIETAEIIRKYDRDCVIIIITAILEYAVEGYSINAFDFILKPINQYKFDKVLLKAIHKVLYFDNQTYVVQDRERALVLKLSSIIYFESRARKVNINCDDKTYESNENITTVERKLKEKGFIRISRYYLVNLRHVKEVHVNDIVLSNGSNLNYSHKYTNDIKKKYMEYMMEGMI